MFLKKINLRAIGPRLALWITLLLTVSLLAVSSTVYYLMSSSLRDTDHAYVLNMSKSYEHNYLHQGIGAVADIVSRDLLVQIVNEKGEILYSSLPEFLDHDFEDEEEIEQIRRGAETLPLKNGWATILLLSGEEDDDLFHKTEYKLRRYAWKKEWQAILPMIDNDMVEVYSSKLSNGHWIRVGKNSEEREEHLAEIRNISIMVLIPFIILGFLLSAWLAHTILSPLKSLAYTIERLQKGESHLRSPLQGSQDEVDLVALALNNLLDQNQKLFENLKSTIDNVAHDLRTPLTRFRVSAEDALTHESLDKLKEALQDGVDSSDKILALLNAIMDASEADSQTMKIRPEPIEVKSFLSGLSELFEYVAEEKNIQFQTHCEENLFILGDRVRLLQAMGNLIDNALKYSPSGSRVHIKAKKSADSVLISIQDQGMGIDPTEHDKIWNRLYRVDKSRSTSGLGIGLSVVSAIIKAHSGSITLQSGLGQGATFIITLPSCNEPVRPL